MKQPTRKALLVKSTSVAAETAALQEYANKHDRVKFLCLLRHFN